MKNIIEILKSQNIELTEEQKSSIQNEVNANYKTVADYDKQKEKLDLANTQLNETKESFDEFKNGYEGIDIDELKGKVDTLNEQLANKDTEYQTKLGTLELSTKLKESLRSKGCIDIDLALTQFDTQALLGSKNQDTELETALNNLYENKKMLFKEAEPDETIDLGGGTANSGDKAPKTLKEALKLNYK